jgi:beta-lactamase regulating signal transducer with metallopeptidase domain
MTGEWFSQPGLERLAGSLLHFVWQGAVIAILAAVTLHLLKRRSSQCRYAVAALALLLMLLAPLATFVFYAETGALAHRLLQIVSRGTSTAVGATDAGIALWTKRIVMLWAAGVGVCLIRLIAGWLLSRGLVRAAETVLTPAVLEAMQRARAALDFVRPVRLLAGPHVDTPVVVGWLRPAILLPTSALTGVAPAHLLAILAHELAHVRRHDFLVNAVQRVVECVLFYHPAVWWLSGQIRVERERCCDDVAVAACGDTLVYAEALIALEQARAREPILAVAAVGQGLGDRVRRILGVGGRSFDWQSSVAVCASVAILAVAGLWQPASARAAVPSAATTTDSVPRSLPVDARRETAPPSSLDALAAIVTARNAQAAAQSVPGPAATPTRVTQPTITPTRTAAREKLGQLRVDYSAESFVKQAAEGDTIAVKLFLAAGMNINARDEKGFTALMSAVRARQQETAQALIAAGADVNLSATPGGSNRPGTALSYAAANGDIETMEIVLRGGANVNSEFGPERETPLTSAVVGGSVDATALLLKRGANIETNSSSGTPLVIAACGRRNDILQLLLDRGASVVNAKRRGIYGDNSLEPVLNCAVSSRNLEGIQLLLEKGADINGVVPSR